MKTLLIGYIPFFPFKEFSGKLTHGDLNAISKVMETLPIVETQSVAWQKDDEGGYGAVLIVENARVLWSHLMEWAEQTPEKFFRAMISERKTGYQFVIVSDPVSGVERYAKNTGVTINKQDTNYVCRPLVIEVEEKKSSVPRGVEWLNVAMMDAKYASPLGFKEEELLQVGKLRLTWNGSIQ